jgi:hypothetical protein
MHQQILMELNTQHCMDMHVDTNVSAEHISCVFRVEDGGSMFFRNIGVYLQIHTALQYRRSTQDIFTAVRFTAIRVGMQHFYSVISMCRP